MALTVYKKGLDGRSMPKYPKYFTEYVENI